MPQKVLIVDDEPGILEVLKDALEDEPYEVLIARSGKEALAILEKERVDLVLADEMMPEMLGHELLSIVREQHPDVVRMMFTAHPSMEVAIKAINEGQVSQFITKPFKVVDLLASFRQALRHKELEKRSRTMLGVIKRQNQLLSSLEKAGGAIPAGQDIEGEIVEIGEGDYMEWEELVKQMHEEVEKGKLFFNKK